MSNGDTPAPGTRPVNAAKAATSENISAESAQRAVRRRSRRGLKVPGTGEIKLDTRPSLDTYVPDTTIGSLPEGFDPNVPMSMLRPSVDAEISRGEDVAVTLPPPPAVPVIVRPPSMPPPAVSLRGRGGRGDTLPTPSDAPPPGTQSSRPPPPVPTGPESTSSMRVVRRRIIRKAGSDDHATPLLPPANAGAAPSVPPRAAPSIPPPPQTATVPSYVPPPAPLALDGSAFSGSTLGHIRTEGLLGESLDGSTVDDSRTTMPDSGIAADDRPTPPPPPGQHALPALDALEPLVLRPEDEHRKLPTDEETTREIEQPEVRRPSEHPPLPELPDELSDFDAPTPPPLLRAIEARSSEDQDGLDRLARAASDDVEISLDEPSELATDPPYDASLAALSSLGDLPEVSVLPLDPEALIHRAPPPSVTVTPPPPPPAALAGARAVQAGGASAAPSVTAPTSPSTGVTGQVRLSGTPTLHDKRRRRLWWEELFNEDYFRTMEKSSPTQVKEDSDWIEQALGVEAGASILDVACGLGTASVELARRGYDVVGLDLSTAMLQRATDAAQEAGAKLTFTHGDMASMDFAEVFDSAFCVGTSFGFFDDERNAEVARRMHKALKPHGTFLLEVINRDHAIQRQPGMAWFEGDGCVCMEETSFNYITSRLNVKRTMIFDDGRQREVEYSVRLYSVHELGQILHEAGFRILEVSGHKRTPGAFFGPTSRDLIILAQKRGPEVVEGLSMAPPAPTPEPGAPS